ALGTGFTAYSLPPSSSTRTVVTISTMARERKYQYDLDFELKLLLTFNDAAYLHLPSVLRFFPAFISFHICEKCPPPPSTHSHHSDRVLLEAFRLECNLCDAQPYPIQISRVYWQT